MSVVRVRPGTCKSNRRRRSHRFLRLMPIALAVWPHVPFVARQLLQQVASLAILQEGRQRDGRTDLRAGIVDLVE